VAAQQQRALLLQVSADKQQECAHALLRVLEAVDYPLCFFVRFPLGPLALGPIPAYADSRFKPIPALSRFPLGPIPTWADSRLDLFPLRAVSHIGPSHWPAGMRGCAGDPDFEGGGGDRPGNRAAS
jgi:hypothetical protein